MKYFKLIFWGISGIGIISPIFIFIPRTLSTFANLPEERLNTIITTFFILPLLPGVPFLALIIFKKIHLQVLQIKNSQTIFYKRASGITGAAIAIFSISSYINIVVSTSKSSTAGIALLLIPFLGIVAIPFGYLCGRFIGNLTLKFKNHKTVSE